MKLSRRQFIGLSSLLGLSSCAKMKPKGLANFVPFTGEKGPLVFAAVNDLHVLDAKSTAIVNRAVKQINEDPEIAFTVILGDIATEGRLQELRLALQCFDKLEKPWFAVPGNHDVHTSSEDPYVNYSQTFGDTQWSNEDEGWLFIGLDTCNGSASDVTVPPERIDWLRGVLKRTHHERPIALFTHHPFNPHTKAYRVANADEVIDVFKTHKLKLVASGHYHGNQAEVRDGILFTTTACCSSTRGNFDKTEEKGYRRFSLDGDAIEHAFVEVH